MKKSLVYLASLVLVMMAAAACGKADQPENKPNVPSFNPFDGTAEATGYYGYAEFSVPAGTQNVYVEYTKKSGETVKEAVPVTPIVAEASEKNVEPFGTVKLLLNADNSTKVKVTYYVDESLATKADAEEEGQDPVIALEDFPLDQVTSGAFGKTRYVQVQWGYAWMNNESTGWQNTPTFPKDVVFYDKEHNHTLRYKFAYTGIAAAAYFLDEAYVIEDYVVKGVKYDYCNNTGCPECMPWGCSCGCGKTNPDFVASGDTTGSAGSGAIVVNPETPGTTEIGDGGTVTVDKFGTIIVDYAPYDATSLKLTEPASYKTSDKVLTAYHSSGVVMFEDSWPTVTKGGVYDTDFDDVVVDYDFEAKVVPDNTLERDWAMEQVKVVLHLRAVGSGNPYRVGVRMEGFDQQYISNIETYFTLDSYNNPHGELPAFTKETLQKMSGVYTQDTKNPVVEMAHLHVMNQERAGSGDNAVYTYKNNSFTNTTVFNLTYGYKGKYANGTWSDNAEWHERQYSPELKTMKLPYAFENIMKQKYYNCIPGYINVSGGLLTYTVIFKMKNRAEMSVADRELAKQNMIDAVMNTLSQNFYIIADNKFTPVGLKGYSPVMIHSESVKSYNDKLATGLSNGYILSESDPYGGKNGMVWGIKCPTLTKHVWNKLYFSDAYPHYEEWITSMGAQHADWYYSDVDKRYLICEW